MVKMTKMVKMTISNTFYKLSSVLGIYKEQYYTCLLAVRVKRNVEIGKTLKWRAEDLVTRKRSTLCQLEIR